MVKKVPVLFVLLASLVIFPLIGNTMDVKENHTESVTVPKKEEVFIKKGDSASQILASSSAKIHVINEDHLYYKHPVELHYSNGKFSLLFKNAQDMHLYLENEIFESLTFHITKSIDWQEESKVREQIKPLYEMLISQGWRLKKTEFTPDNVPFPIKTQSEMLFVWTTDDSQISISVRRMTFPKDLFPRDNEIYRLTIYIDDLKSKLKK